MTIEFSSVQTKRLFLRPLQPADAVTLFRIYQSEGVLRYFPNSTPPPLERVERFIDSQQARWEKHGYGNWGVLLGGDARLVGKSASKLPGEIIGWAGLQYLPELEETEVGFLFDRPFWGKGYATEAALASLRFGFEGYHLDHIIALVHPENIASRRVIEKCGMSFVDSLALWGMELMRHRINKEEFLETWALASQARQT